MFMDLCFRAQAHCQLQRKDSYSMLSGGFMVSMCRVRGSGVFGFKQGRRHTCRVQVKNWAFRGKCPPFLSIAEASSTSARAEQADARSLHTWRGMCHAGPSDMRPSLPASDQSVSGKQVLLVSARTRARKLDCYTLEQLASAD